METGLMIFDWIEPSLVFQDGGFGSGQSFGRFGGQTDAQTFGRLDN